MLPPPQLSIHPVANGWIVILYPPERLSFSRVMRMALESVSRAPTLMAALQAFHVSLKEAGGNDNAGLAVSPTGVGVAPGSPAEAADRVTQSVTDAVRPIETAEREARASEPQCFICRTQSELVGLVSAIYLGESAYSDPEDEDEDEDDDDDEGDPS